MHPEIELGYRIEAAAFRAWPPAETLNLSGWIVRLSSGYTGRANSVNPQGAADPPFAARVARCEALFRDANLTPLFRITDLEDYSGLEQYLRAHGYAEGSPTTVLAAPCIGGSTTALRALESGDWLPLHSQFTPTANSDAHREILERITDAHLYAALQVNTRIVAVGLAVIYEELLGLFDIVVAESHRGSGCGTALVQNMLAWGSANGAKTAYLQVADHNHIARRLYERLGFRVAYHYHYYKKIEATDAASME